ncbi:PAS domain S-box protein [Methylomonas sp. SURF-2]|uniref:histidine kinase n=1 Tax=Methylomonas subterranea TaxID=2952225 RepID=A0ABT1TGF1_9GAMM|nr:PAS domain S-box protein [Methylomonas sp. SURF-2]MCQ8104543.1 PAS domain S-box protein [Methylomonas sp. SURF-2]
MLSRYMPVEMRLKSSVAAWLKWLLVAGLYLLTAKLALNYFAPEGRASVFFIASGLALAAILLGGRRYAWAILTGALLLNILQGKPLAAAAIISIGSTAGAWLGARLLCRTARFDRSLKTLRDYLLLITLGGVVACSLPAVIGSLTLLGMGTITKDIFFNSLLHWWMGDTLGVILMAPLILVWCNSTGKLSNPKQFGEAALILGINFWVGQLVFLDWFHDSLGAYAKSYWVFLCICWAAVRLGSRATTLILLLTSAQAMYGLTQHRLGFFDHDLGDRHDINYWFFMVAVSVVGMALASYFAERQHALEILGEKEELLRTFLNAMPDKVWLKNPDGVYLLCNRSFELLYGASEQQIVGKTDYDFVGSEQADFFRARDVAAMTAGKARINQEWLTDADGSHKALYETIKTPVNTHDGKLIGVLGMARDITQLRETQIALEERIKEQKCLHAVFHATEDLQKPLADVMQAVVELLPAGWFYPNITAACIDWDGQSFSTDNFVSTADLDRLSAAIEIDGLAPGQITVCYLAPRPMQQEGPFLREERQLLNTIAERLGSFLQRRRAEQAARNRERIFSSIVSQATDAITLIDAESLEFIEFNDAACQSLGYSRAEFACLRLNDIQGEFDLATMRNMINDFMPLGFAQFDTLRRHKNGSLRNVHVSIKVIEIDGHQYLSLIWSDITERKQIEQQFRHLFDHNPAPMLIYERGSLAMVAVNDAFTALYGYSQDEIAALKLTDLYPEEQKQAIADLAAGLHGYAYVGEWRHILKNGCVIDIIVRSHDINFAERTCRVAVITDITELKQAEAELRKLWLAVEQSPNSIVITNLDANIEYVNRHFSAVTGYSREEAIGQNPRILQSGQTSQATYEQMWEKITQGDSWSGELINRRKDGSEYIEWAQITPVRQPDGTITHYLAIKEDITEKKQVELELDSYRHNLENLVAARTRELELARRQAEAATVAKSQFLANMSHEIRTPMNAILGMLYLALKHQMPAALHNHLSKAQSAAHSLLGIINDILDFSKIEAGKLEFEATEFALDGVLEQLTDAIGLQAEQKGVEFLIRYDVKIPSMLQGDPLRLKQILLNLCGNAIKFTERGEVELGLRMLSNKDGIVTLQMSVRDTGIGMDNELQNRLFQKFTQADQSTTRRFGGTGLGLAISKHLVELMGGRIWVEDTQPGKGTTICCTLQLRIARQAEMHKSELYAQTGPLLKGIRVLVVDDNAVSREILAEMLRYFQLEVSVAADGLSALQLLQASTEQAFDLVLMDWRMPGMNGDEATRRIHADSAIAPKPKVIMVTAYGREEVMLLAQQAGVDGFLIKPVSPSSLLDSILTVLERGSISGRQDKTLAIAHSIAPPDFAGVRVLLVEDNAINREFATELLLSMHLDVDEAINGEEALSMVQQQDYDAVLMDIQMPVMDGLEATRQIRALAKNAGNERFATLPIIAMTALAMTRDAEESLAAGMNDHVTKPVEPTRLFACLSKWLPPAGAEARQNSLTTIQAPAGRNAYSAELLGLSSLQALQGIKRIGGKEESYRKQLKRFREHYSNTVTELQRLLRENKLTEAEAYCHSLKGVTGNIGAHLLYQCISGIDNQLKQQQTPSTEQLNQLNVLLQQVMLDIDSLAAAPTSVAAATVPLSKDAVIAKVALLLEVLETDLGAAETIISQLRAGLAGSALANDVNEIADQMEVFNIDQAMSLLSELQQRLLADVNSINHHEHD